jgi:uncharacterized protein
MNASMVVVGLIVGLCVGMTGVGGSSLTAPILLLVFGVSPAIAVGTDIIYSVPTKILGTFVHWRKKTIDLRAVALLSAGGLPGVLVGLLIFAAARGRYDTKSLDALIRHGVGIALLVAAAALVFSSIIRARSPEREKDEPVVWGGSLQARMIAIGFVVGIAVSLTSIGAGSLTLPLLYLIGPRLGLRRFVGSDIAFAAIILPFAAVGHFSMGNISIPVATSLLAGSIPGVYVGSQLAGSMPERILRPVVAVVLVAAGSRLF